MGQSLVNGETEEAASGRSENGIFHSGMHIQAPEPVLTDGPKVWKALETGSKADGPQDVPHVPPGESPVSEDARCLQVSVEPTSLPCSNPVSS